MLSPEESLAGPGGGGRLGRAALSGGGDRWQLREMRCHQASVAGKALSVTWNLDFCLFIEG